MPIINAINMTTKIFKHGWGALVALLALSSASCSDDNASSVLTPAITPSSIVFNLPEATRQLLYTDDTGAECLPMIKGETLKLSYTLAPDSVTYKDVVWSSSSPAVASVDETGYLQAISGAGTGYSLVEVAPRGMYPGSGINATLKVVVSDELVRAQSITVSSSAEELYGGDTLHLSAAILPATSTYKTVKWSSSDEQVATVDAAGVLTAKEISSLSASVTVTATALDGSGVAGSKQLLVRRIVQPQDVSIAQNYSADNGYRCALNERGLTLTYTTTPSESTVSLLRWTSSDETVATVDNGEVTFKGFGEATITATCPATGKSSTVKLSIPKGLVRETYHNKDHYSFYNASQSGNGTSTSHTWHDGYVTINTYTVNATTQRADIKCYDLPLWLHAGNYPFFAIKMDDVKDKGAGSRNINVDAVGTTESGTSYSALGGGNNKYTYSYKCSDGSRVFIYDLTKVAFGTGGLLPANEGAGFTIFQIKYADMKGLSSPISYNLYWVQTFKSLADVQNYITSEGLTYE